MRKIFSSIILNWNATGNIKHKFSGGYSNLEKNLLLSLAPSLPLLVSHQLGTLRPSHGLILCSQILDFYCDGKHINLPINPAHTSAQINYVSSKRTRHGATIQFSPKYRILSNRESIEEGVRQFLNNYLKYVYDCLAGYWHTRIVVKGFICGAVGIYFEIIETQLSENYIGPSKDKWSTKLSIGMANSTTALADMYGPTYNNDYEAEQSNKTISRNFLEYKKQHNQLTKSLGLR